MHKCLRQPREQGKEWPRGGEYSYVWVNMWQAAIRKIPESKLGRKGDQFQCGNVEIGFQKDRLRVRSGQHTVV